MTMDRAVSGAGTEDHPGWPDTPGLKAASDRIGRAETAHRRATEDLRRAERRRTIMAEAGERLSRLVDDGTIDACALSGDIVALLKTAKEA